MRAYEYETHCTLRTQLTEFQNVSSVGDSVQTECYRTDSLKVQTRVVLEENEVQVKVKYRLN